MNYPTTGAFSYASINSPQIYLSERRVFLMRNVTVIFMLQLLGSHSAARCFMISTASLPLQSCEPRFLLRLLN